MLIVELMATQSVSLSMTIFDRYSPVCTRTCPGLESRPPVSAHRQRRVRPTRVGKLKVSQSFCSVHKPSSRPHTAVRRPQPQPTSNLAFRTGNLQYYSRCRVRGRAITHAVGAGAERRATHPRTDDSPAHDGPREQRGVRQFGVLPRGCGAVRAPCVECAIGPPSQITRITHHAVAIPVL